MDENIKNLVKVHTDNVKDKPKIFESPDNGKTVYWRYFMEDERHLLYCGKDKKYPWENKYTN